MKERAQIFLPIKIFVDIATDFNYVEIRAYSLIGS